MPALRYCSNSGAQKARIAALAVGESIIAGSLAEARSLRAAAVGLSLRVSVYRQAKNIPAHIVKLCGQLTPANQISPPTQNRWTSPVEAERREVSGECVGGDSLPNIDVSRGRAQP